jgi:hypothetical protein
MVPAAFAKPFEETLLAGGYNLLVGSGISLDSRNGRGEQLRSAEELRRDLCNLTGARENTSLTRVYALLSGPQVQAEIVDKFLKCSPGPSLQPLPFFLWRRIFTFNVDDVLENLYKGTAKQGLVPLSFKAAFEPTPDRRELQAIHLHGSALWPGEGFVFAATEYVKVMSALNPWMHLLSEILATEPFIIAGTSLNEIDLEYYLSYRNSTTPRRGRGPSLLIEPYPDVATRADCDRHGLVLVQATFGDFLGWLRSKFPSPPSVQDLIVPDVGALFTAAVTPVQLLRFFSDFELVPGTDRPTPSTPSAFMYGREPDWADMQQHFDIERQDNAELKRFVDMGSAASSRRLGILLDDAGTGKTTAIKRLAHDLAKSGQPVLSIRTLSRIDANNAVDCLSQCTAPQVVLIADDFADHAEQVAELLEAESLTTRFLVVAAERAYRGEYLDVLLGDLPRFSGHLTVFSLNESQQLLEQYRRFGLVGDSFGTKAPRAFANQIHEEPVAIQVCQILNDFRPLERIVESLWLAAKDDDRLPYVCVALAQYCYSAGIRYSILQAIMGPTKPVGPLMGKVPLRLVQNAVQDEFVVAINATLAERVLRRTADREKDVLSAAFKGLARGLAPHVNRKAVMRRSPEARLAGRLFDADKVVKPLLGSGAEEFYVSVQKLWEWNSRYWEQRALLQAESDLSTGLQFARHAVAIEKHPFPLTTLGKLLLRAMESGPSERASVFGEAFETLSDAIESAVKLSRISVHPFGTLLAGAARYLELGGELTAEQRAMLDGYRAEARFQFSGDPLIEAALRRLDADMS